MYVVFSYFLRVGDAVPYYPVYLLLGIVLWNFFGEITNQSVGAIVGRGDLIRKINFPKYVIVLSSVISATINLLLNSIIIIIFMVIMQVPLSWRILAAPVYLIELATFALSVGFILSTLFVKFRDIGYIWEIIMQALFYATPILYPVSLVVDKWPVIAELILISPIAHAIQGLRYAIITPEAQTLLSVSGNIWVNLIPFAITIIVALIAVKAFRSQSANFAENV